MDVQPSASIPPADDAPSDAGPVPVLVSSPAGPSPFEVRLLTALGPTLINPWQQPNEPDEIMGLTLYARNVRVAASLWPALHATEVLLRQRLSDALATLHPARLQAIKTYRHQVPHWLDGEPSLLHPTEQYTVADTIKQMKLKGKLLTPESLFTEMPLRFWMRLVGTNYETPNHGQVRLWSAAAPLVLPDAKREYQTRTALEQRLEVVRDLRNAVAHHAPICVDANLTKKHQIMLHTIEMLSKDAAEVLRVTNPFWQAYKQKDEDIAGALRKLAHESRGG